MRGGRKEEGMGRERSVLLGVAGIMGYYRDSGGDTAVWRSYKHVSYFFCVVVVVTSCGLVASRLQEDSEAGAPLTQNAVPF